MNKYYKILLILSTIPFVIIGGFLVYKFYDKSTIKSNNARTLYSNKKEMNQLIIKSPYFNNNEFIPKKFTCDGEDAFPELIIENIPNDAKTITIVVDDPDAPMERPFVHLLAANIPTSDNITINENILKNSILGKNDFGKLGWNGPCPPHGHGIHHYHFKIVALNNALPLQEGFDIFTLSEILDKFEDNIVGYGELIGLYQR